MSFRWITAEDFAPFGSLKMDLPAVPDRTPGLGEVHLLVGGNGSGKTRLLSVMTALFRGIWSRWPGGWRGKRFP